MVIDRRESNHEMAELPRREREKLRRRNDIVDAAEKRFFERGFDGVSMDEVARDLELSKPALYRYFRNKESMYLAVVLRGMVILRDSLKKAVEKERTGGEKVRGFIEVICFDYVRTQSDYYRLLVVAREQRFMDMYNKGEIEGANRFGSMASELLTFMIDAIKLGIEDGTIKENLDPLQTAIFLAVTAEATVNLTSEYQDLLNQKGETKNGYLRHSIDLMLSAISSDDLRKATR